MTSSHPTSIILPTTSGTGTVDEILSQMSQEDELLVVCDSEEDEIAKSDVESREGMKLVVAGEPEGCSGKANAIHAGMKAAGNGRVVWTDDDFRHPGNWLEQLHKYCDKYGAVSELPFFVGKNSLTAVNEPVYALVMFFTYLENQVWGGSVMFERDRIDEEKFLEELQSTVSDDALLSEYLNSRTVRQTRRVEIDSTVRDALERMTRFVKIVRYHEPLKTVLLSSFSVVLALACLLYPIHSFAASTIFFLSVYLFLGERRPTFIFGYLSLILLPFVLLYSLVRKTFVWHGRRYQYMEKLDVDILDRKDR